MSKVTSFRLEESTIHMLEETGKLMDIWSKAVNSPKLVTNKSHIVACGIQAQYRFWKEEVEKISSG